MTLTEAHRIAQLRLGAALVILLRSKFRLLDPTNLDATFEDWLVVVERLVSHSRQLSARMAATYLSAQRVAALGFDSSFAPILAAELRAEALRTSLLVTGPISIKNAMGRGGLLAQAVDIAEARSSAAAMRHALDGGRETITATVRADPRAVGWQRVASGKACQFCSSLTDRTYSENGADFAAHDGCSCSAEPVFR